MSELQNPVWLSEASEIIGADYIILYDHNGDEVVTNARYKGLSLGKKESSATYDFRRLLRGVRYIYHDNIKDEVTGLTRNLHGISVDLNSDETSYGAMLIAFEPNEYPQSGVRNCISWVFSPFELLTTMLVASSGTVIRNCIPP